MPKILKQFLLITVLSVLSLGQTLSGGGSTRSAAGAAPPPPQPSITSPVPPIEPPDGIQGQAYSALFIGAGGTPPYAWSLTGQLMTGASFTTVSNQGVLSAVTLGGPGTFSFNVKLTDSLGQVASFPYTNHIVAATPPSFTTVTAPGDGVVGTPYQSIETFAGGTGPYTCALNSGAYPAGLSLSTVGLTCVLQGTPTTATTYTYTLKVTDSLANTAVTPSRVVIVQNSPPVIGNALPPSPVVTGTQYLFVTNATGGSGTYSWSNTGTLPPGLVLTTVSNVGQLAGALGLPGTYNFTLIAKDLVTNLTGTRNYTIVVTTSGTGVAMLPQAWHDSHECDGKFQHTLAFPADGLGKHGGVAYANTQAGVDLAFKDAADQRDLDGTGTDVVMPANSPFTSANTTHLRGANTATGNNSTNCIAITSSSPLDPKITGTACVRDVLPGMAAAPGCPVDKPHMWQMVGTTTATPVIDCVPGTAGPAHHYLLQDFELTYTTTGPPGINGTAALYCGTNAETTVAQLPHHMDFTRYYIHGYDSPDIDVTRAIFYAMNNAGINYGYTEMIHANGKDAQAIATQQSQIIKIDHNWIRGGSEGSMIGGGPPLIPGFTPSDFEIRANRWDRDFADLALSSVVGHTFNWSIKNRFEIKNAQRVLMKGNYFEQSWGDGQAGFLVLFNVRACASGPGCTGGNDSVIQDLRLEDSGFAHAAQGIQTDGSSEGNNVVSGGGNGQSLHARRWQFKNLWFADIGDNTRYPVNCPQVGCNHTPPYNAYTSVHLQLGAAGQNLVCSVVRDGTGTIATATCASQGNVPGTGMQVGDAVLMQSCTDASFNVGNTGIGPTVITGAPNSLVLTYANTGTANASTSCNLINTAGIPDYFTYDHISDFSSVGSSWFATEGQSPSLRYPRHNSITNSIIASNGGNPGGLSGGGLAEGLPIESLWDITTFHFNCNVLTGRKSSLYSVFQTGECANDFPGNNAGGANNSTGVVCSGATPDATCVGATGLMNGVPYVANRADYHDFMLMPNSVFAAGQAKQASDGTDRGANFTNFDLAMKSTIFVCDTPCGNGPFRDDLGVFMVPNSGDNVDGCTEDKPCDSFAAAKVALTNLPINNREVTLRNGTYRLGSTLTFAAADGGNQQEDMIRWFCMDATRRLSFHLTGAGVYNGCWLGADGHTIWQVKASTGHPWDIHYYDANWIYFWMTENGDIVGGFNNASGWKRKIVPTPSAPRYFIPGSDVIADSPGPVGAANMGASTANCETDGIPPRALGSVRFETTGGDTASIVNWGGDVGSQKTITLSYFYSGNNSGVYQNREQYFLVKDWGVIQWQHANLTGGVYVVDQTSLKNILTAGAVPAPFFPCGTNFPWWVGSTPGVGGNAANPGTAGVIDTVTYKGYPGEDAKVTGNQQLTGLVDQGATCGAGCEQYSVTKPAASWQNFMTAYYNGKRRPRPISTGSVHNWKVNACPLSTNDDAFMCKTGISGGSCTVGTAQQIADCNCACPAGVTAAGGHCAFLQTKICSSGGATPWQCANRYLVTGADVSGTWHAQYDLDYEIAEDWTMSRLHPLSVSGGQVSWTGAAGPSNNHGCEGGHHYVVENVRELATKGQYYFDRDPTNTGSVGPNWTFNIYADTSTESPLTDDIEYSQLDPASPQVISGTGVNYMTFRNLTFAGDNWQPGALGLGDAQMMPNVTGALTFTNSSHLMFDSITVRHTAGWGMIFEGSSNFNTIQNSHLWDIGAGGIRFGTGVVGNVIATSSDTDVNVPQFNTISNNLVENFGRIQPSGEGSGIALGDGHHFLIDHNEIARGYSGGIELCFALGRGIDGAGGLFAFCHDNVVSNNRIYDMPNAILVDHGGAYFATSLSSACPNGLPINGLPCNKFINNFVSDIYNNYDLTVNAANSGDRDAYMDQGTSHVLIQNNLLIRAGTGAIRVNLPQTTGTVNPFLPQDNYINNNILGQCGYQNGTFIVNLSTSCINKNGNNGSSFTAEHNIFYVNALTSLFHIQNLIGPWGCTADDNTTLVPCTQRFTFARNVYWNIAGLHPLVFATCKTVAQGATVFCGVPIGNTNWNLYPVPPAVSNGQIPSGWTNPYQSNGSAAGEDVGSLADNPGFVNPTCGVDDWHYTKDYSAQGIVKFDYTTAGRLPGSPYTIQTVPDLFPVRPVNCLTDF